jgi:hypothetical protein
MKNYRQQKALHEQRMREADFVFTVMATFGAMFFYLMFIPNNYTSAKILGQLMLFLTGVLFAAIRFRQVNRVVYWFMYISGMIIILGSGYINPWMTIGVNALWIVIVLYFVADVDTPDEVYLRGQPAETAPPVRSLPPRRMDDAGFFWGATTLPSEFATKNNMVVGTVGSGKTLTINMFMASVLKDLFALSKKRALIFDPKGENYSVINGCLSTNSVIILNPFDQRCAAWDMAQDITNPAEAQALAEILVPANPFEKDPFWRFTVLTLLEGLVVWFILHAPGVWDLRDIVLIMLDENALRAILSSDRRTEPYLLTLGSQNTTANIFATVSTRMRPYGIVAACWDRANSRISLHEWLKYSVILLLGESEVAPMPVRAINQLIFTRAAQLLLDLPEQDQTRQEPSTYIIMDELPALGKLDKLKTLATKGRSKGVCITIGFQDIEDMRHVYGREVAHTILGQFNNNAFLRINSTETAKWASQSFSSYEFMEKNVSRSSGGGNSGDSYSERWNRAQREVVSPIEFMTMEPTGPQNGLRGFYQIQGKAYEETLPWEEITQRLPKRADIPDFIPRPRSDYWLDPFTSDDLQRLNLTWLADEILEEAM